MRNGLLGDFAVSPERIGALFEHLVFSQVTASAAARDVDMRVSPYRTEHGGEVDLVVEHRSELWALELKASRTVSRSDLRGLRSFADFVGRAHRPLVLYLGEQPRTVNGVDVLPWQDGLAAMDL